MRGDVLVLTLAVTLAFLQYTEACTCMESHPQTHFCTSDFVILARVKSDKVLNTTRVYKVRIRKPYKMSEKAHVALKSGRLLTAPYDSMCGIDLEVGKLYVISGRVNSLKAHINLCGMAIQWQDLSKRQRKGLKAIYKHGCSCRVNLCKHRRCTKTPDTCLMTSDCHAKEGICLRGNSKKCTWTRNRALTSCLKTHPLTISRWSG